VQKLLIINLLTICLLKGISPVKANADIEILTSDLSPYSIEVGLRPGFLVEIVSLIEDRLSTSRSAQYFPWARSQMIVATQENKIIFPLTRTPEREPHYDWIIDVAPIEYVFVTVDGRQLSLEEARGLKRISVQQSTPFESYLKRNGFKNLISSPMPGENHLRLLMAKRTQAWFTAKDLAQYAVLNYGLQKVTISDPVKTARVYIATSKKFPPKLKREYQRIFNELLEDGTIAYILKQYRGR